MGRLAIRRVSYIGKNYYFESPHLDDGIVILEGENGHGKSTFMDLIYFGFGGKVDGFNKDDKKTHNKHTEIYNDTENYVELELIINDETYEFTRYFNKNIVYVVDSNEHVDEFNVYRNADNGNGVLSDWILAKLSINVFDMIQGTKQFKIGFNDLLRLVYYDQKTEIEKIYKAPDNENYVSDSSEIRKAIFEILVGKIYDNYYSFLAKYKQELSEYDKQQAVLDSYDEFLHQILDGDIDNVKFIKSEIEKYEDIIEQKLLERDIARNNEGSSDEIFDEIRMQRRNMERLQLEKDSVEKIFFAINNSIGKIFYLQDEAKREINEVEKIRFIDKKMKLFSPNTCPYCLHEVKRENGKCICGSEIDEAQYEKFFYTDAEYVEIINAKKKSLKSLNELLEKKRERKRNVESELKEFQTQIREIQEYIIDLEKDIGTNYNSAYTKHLDEEIAILNTKNVELDKARELAEKKETLVSKCIQLRNSVDALKVQVDLQLNKAKADMLEKKRMFNEVYVELMKVTDSSCNDAYLGDDYMPYINGGAYRERSAYVSKRLMFFLTLLLLSLKTDMNYPQFLMIDTPNKEGIDPDKLIEILASLDKTNEIGKQMDKEFQIILTTGLGIYPKEFQKYVFLTLDGNDKLLKKKQ